MYKILWNFLLLFAQILTRFIETYRSTANARNLSCWFNVYLQMCRCTECLWVSASLGLLYESQDNALVLNSGSWWYEDYCLFLLTVFFLSKATSSQPVNLCAAPYVGALYFVVYRRYARLYHTGFSAVLKVPTVDKVFIIGKSSTLLPGCSFTVYSWMIFSGLVYLSQP